MRITRRGQKPGTSHKDSINPTLKTNCCTLFNPVSGRALFHTIHSEKGTLLVIRSVPRLIRVVGSRHLALGRGALHSGRRGPPGGWPYPRAQSSRLVERGTERSLVLRELRHGIGVVVVRRWGIDRRAPMLGRGPRWGVVHVGGHLVNDVSRGWSDGRRGRGHGGRGLVVHHMGGP